MDNPHEESHATIDGMLRITFCGRRAKWFMLEGVPLVTAFEPPKVEGGEGIWHDVLDEVTCVECREAYEAEYQRRSLT